MLQLHTKKSYFTDILSSSFHHISGKVDVWGIGGKQMFNFALHYIQIVIWLFYLRYSVSSITQFLSYESFLKKSWWLDRIWRRDRLYMCKQAMIDRTLEIMWCSCYFPFSCTCNPLWVSSATQCLLKSKLRQFMWPRILNWRQYICPIASYINIT